MADSMIQAGLDIAKRYSTGSTSSTSGRDIYTNPADYEKEQAIYEDKTTLSFTDMLGLMVAQFQNQSIDNQASTTDMMNQLVQMSSMQAMTDMTSNIKELALANVMAYSASLVGQTVTIGIWNEQTKELEDFEGVVEGAGTYNGQQVVFVNGKSYALSSIMAVGKLPPRVEEDDKTENKDDKVEQTPGAETEDSKNEKDTAEVPKVDNDNAVG